MSRPEFRLKRVYLPPSTADGSRVLVDRLWPRGLARARARVDLWCRALAPSDALRRQFHGELADWNEFKAAYYTELARPEAEAAVQELLERVGRGPATLLFAARDEARNNAVALKKWLDRKFG